MLLSNIATQDFYHVSNQWKKMYFFLKKGDKVSK